MLRKTDQILLPIEKKENSIKKYNIFPSFHLHGEKIKIGFEKLAEKIMKEKTVIIDGYGGVFWEKIRMNLQKHFNKKGISVSWHKVEDAMFSEDKINKLISPYLGGDDPLFGTRFKGELSDLYSKKDLNNISRNSDVKINIIYGSGAALSKWDGYLVYIDLPKNEVQYRARAQVISNLGSSKYEAVHKMYKRFYFIDWVLLNKHKKKLLEKIDLIVDGQRPGKPTIMEGDSFRDALKEMSKNYFRVRPWFEPGSWGGQWIKNEFKDLPQNVPNYAWSFELIVPENGLIFESGNKLLEVSFDFLMYYNSEAILGSEGEKQFKDEFPIRIDYLDTIKGGDLSIQCHPEPEYIKNNFGENFTQDETYYILESDSDSSVYLGFQDNIDQKEFREKLETSRKSLQNDQVDDIPVKIEDYVQKYSSKKHDFFLIPHGTIHGSGSGNLVLEISATPYIFTFKLYDWLRKSSNKPRPINIERGFKNLDFEYQGEKVREELISIPSIIEKGEDWRLVHIPTHDKHFYDVHRYEFNTEVDINTNNSCNVIVVIEGDSVILKTKEGKEQLFNYGETFVVPAAAEAYKIINKSDSEAKVLKVFLK